MKLKDLITEQTLSGETIISVDIQPEYESSVTFLHEWVDFINENYEDNDIVFLYNGRSLGMVGEQQYGMWLWENGIEERVLDTAVFYDKGYAFFRYCMDKGVDEDKIVDLVVFMMDNNIRDSREIDEEMWDQFIEQYGHDGVRDILEFAGDMITIPELMDELKKYNNIVLTGGHVRECLKEVEIALRALGKRYQTLNRYTY